VVFALWVSTMAAEGLAFLPGVVAQHDYDVVADAFLLPSRRKARR